MNNQHKLSNGYTLIGVMVSIVMLGTFSMMMLTTSNFFNNNQMSIRENTLFEQESRNKVLEVYEENKWENLTKETVTTPVGDLTVTYIYQTPGEYYTESVDITFNLNENVKELTLERSVVENE